MKIVTTRKHPVRLSFVNIAEPRKGSENEKPKYSVCIMFPKTDVELKAMFDNAVKGAAAESADKKWGGKVPSGLRLPIHDGNDKADERPEFKGMWYFNASSSRRPGVLDVNGFEMMDLSELYSGCWARVSVNFAGYNFNGSKGVGAYIENIKKLKDDTRLGGSSASAEDDFADDDEEDDDDLM